MPTLHMPACLLILEAGAVRQSVAAVASAFVVLRLSQPRICTCNRYTKVYGGRATNDEEIAGFLIATLFAGQHTSSITSSWTGYQMLDTKVCL